MFPLSSSSPCHKCYFQWFHLPIDQPRVCVATPLISSTSVVGFTFPGISSQPGNYINSSLSELLSLLLHLCTTTTTTMSPGVLNLALLFSQCKFLIPSYCSSVLLIVFSYWRLTSIIHRLSGSLYPSGVRLAAGMAVPEDVLEVKSVFGADCTLQCTARYIPGVEYRAVRWYKVKEIPHFVCFHVVH